MITTLAYLDPGGAGAILQLIGGGLAALAVAARLYWRRLLRMLRIGRHDVPPASSQDAGSS